MVDPAGSSCPRCGGTRIRRLYHGPVDYEMFLELGPGEPDFELAGLADAGLMWSCTDCRHAWGRPDTPKE